MCNNATEKDSAGPFQPCERLLKEAAKAGLPPNQCKNINTTEVRPDHTTGVQQVTKGLTIQQGGGDFGSSSSCPVRSCHLMQAVPVIPTTSFNLYTLC
jgi:phage FluMu protein Com